MEFLLRMHSTSSKQRIRFGRDSHKLNIPRGELVAWMEPACPPPIAPAEEIIRCALEKPIGSASLQEIASGKNSAAILVPGKDRVAGANLFVLPLLEELNRAGIPDDKVVITIATGTHIKHSSEEISQLLGHEVASRIRWREHDCKNNKELRYIGLTKFGTSVFIDHAVLDADVKILTGRIIPHYFAGFGGGRKALLPGVAGFRTICQNHSLTLDHVCGIHPQVRPCSLRENPVHLDMLEAARLVKPIFILNTLLDTNHNIISAFAGELEAAHDSGCTETERIFKIGIEQPLDAVITSAGGWPYDCNFMQALKAVFDIQEIVRPGGAILWIAECSEGMKKGFLDLAHIESDEELDRSVRSCYNLEGHNSIMLRKVTRNMRVALWSVLPDHSVRALGLEPVHSLQESVDWLLRVFPDNFRYAVVPFANVTYTTLV